MLTGSVVTMPRSVRTRLLLVVPARTRAAAATLGRVVWRTVSSCMRYRVLGLAAESAFFAVLSLPPLLFGLAGAVGYIANTFSVQTVATFREQILQAAGTFLTTDTITGILAPTLDDVLTSGRVDVMSIGFLLALWSGSRAMSVFIDTVTIMSGHNGTRGIIHAKALSFSIYIAFLVLSAVVLPLLLAGPDLIARVLPAHLGWLGQLYWPTVLAGSVSTLTTLYSWAVPARRRWRADVPGALLTLVTWLGGSWVLRRFMTRSMGGASLYGPLATPIALLMWLYVVSLAVLIGAAFNAAVGSSYPRIAAVRRQMDASSHSVDAEAVG